MELTSALSALTLAADHNATDSDICPRNLHPMRDDSGSGDGFRRIPTGQASSQGDLELVLADGTAVIDSGKFMVIDCSKDVASGDSELALALAPDMYDKVRSLLSGRDCSVELWTDDRDLATSDGNTRGPLQIADGPRPGGIVLQRDLPRLVRGFVNNLQDAAPFQDFLRWNYRIVITVFKVFVFLEIFGMGINGTTFFWLLPVLSIAAYLWQAGLVERYMRELTRHYGNLALDLPHVLPEQPVGDIEGLVRADLQEGTRADDLHILRNVQATQNGGHYGFTSTMMMFVGSFVPSLYANWVREDHQRRERHLNAYRSARRRLEQAAGDQDPVERTEGNANDAAAA
jgi:hypothetical protein